MGDRQKAVYRSEYERWRVHLRTALAARLWTALCPASKSWPGDSCGRALRECLDDATAQRFLDYSDANPPPRPSSKVSYGFDAMLPGELRKRHGVYFTPPQLAARVAALVGDSHSVLDPAAGDGALLSAVGARWPATRLFALELDPDLAVACAVRGIVEGLNMRVWCADGLGLVGPDSVETIVMNPPYLGEKGNAEVFDAVRTSHPHLEDALVARTDLANLFLYRALQRLGPEGRMVAVTSEYWLQSDAGAPLRSKIVDGYNLRLVERFGAGMFPDAPGHHTLVSVIESGAQQSFETVTDRTRVVHEAEELRAVRWNPFAEASDKAGTPLGEITKTSQGFVSGADRLTRRHLRSFEISGEPGEPIFLFEERPAGELGEQVEPVLRGSQVEPGAVIREFEPVVWALYVDAELDPDHPAVKHLEKFRPILERRREARTGAMPWYRMHWPRDRNAMARPKLVTPRRAARPTFALDLTGSIVSSDCTFIVAPDSVDDPAEFLMRLMADLNSEASDQWLRRYGKVKGDLIEFYAGPLEALPVNADRLFSTG